MQTHTIQFNRPLKKATLIPAGTSHLPGNQSRKSDPAATDKLTKTATADPANLPPSASEIREFFTKIEQQIGAEKASRAEVIEDFQELAIRLATLIATAVVRHEVNQHDGRIRELIASFREEQGENTPLEVRVNKTDLDRLQLSIPELKTPQSTIKLTRDDSVVTGNCQLESPTRNVVADYERQLDEIQQKLMESLQDARAEPDHSETHDQGN